MVSGYAGAPQFDRPTQTKPLLSQSEVSIQACEQVASQSEGAILPQTCGRNNGAPHVI